MLVCPKCRTANEADRASCSACGFELIKNAEPLGELEPVPPAPKTIPGVAAEPLQPAPAPFRTMMGVAAPALPPEVPPPAEPAKGFKQTMIGLAPGALVAPRPEGTSTATKTGTAKLDQADSPFSPMAPAAAAINPFQTLLGVAPSAALGVGAKNEAQQTLLGAGEPAKREGTVQLPAGSAKGTLIGVAIPGIAPINPGVEKAAPPEPGDGPTPATELNFDSMPPASAPHGASQRRYVALALTITAVFLGLVTLLAIGWWRTTPRLTVVVKTDESGKDSLEIECGNCDDGSKISLIGATAQFVQHRATLPLKQPLKMGDNLVVLELARQGARQEAIQLKVPVDYRVSGDVAGIEDATPKLRLLVDKSPSVSFDVEGQPLRFDAAGHGQFELDVTNDITGQAPTEKPLQKRIRYTARTASGDTAGAVSIQVGILPLLIDAPGPLLITDRGEFRLCGNTMPGANIDVAGLKIDVDKNGHFCHLMLIKELGRFSIWVTARAKGYAPRRVERTIERNSDLIGFAKKLYKELPHDAKKAAPGTEKLESSLIAVTGSVVELSENPPITRVLLRLDSRYTQEGLVRVVATNQARFAAGQTLTVFGQVTGSLRGPDGRDMPEISAAFMTPSVP